MLMKLKLFNEKTANNRTQKGPKKHHDGHSHDGGDRADYIDGGDDQKKLRS